MNEQQTTKSDTTILLILHGLLLIGIVVSAPVLVLGFVGNLVGLLTNAPYSTTNFKLTLLVALITPVTGFGVGWKYRRKWWGKLISIVSIWIWAGIGLVAFGPV